VEVHTFYFIAGWNFPSMLRVEANHPMQMVEMFPPLGCCLWTTDIGGMFHLFWVEVHTFHFIAGWNFPPMLRVEANHPLQMVEMFPPLGCCLWTTNIGGMFHLFF
jgi:hypothetical protein